MTVNDTPLMDQQLPITFFGCYVRDPYDHILSKIYAGHVCNVCEVSHVTFHSFVEMQSLVNNSSILNVSNVRPYETGDSLLLPLFATLSILVLTMCEKPTMSHSQFTPSWTHTNKVATTSTDT